MTMIKNEDGSITRVWLFDPQHITYQPAFGLANLDELDQEWEMATKRFWAWANDNEVDDHDTPSPPSKYTPEFQQEFGVQ
jgi:hypothetical protein